MGYLKFQPSVKPLCEESNEDIYYIFYKDYLLVKVNGVESRTPTYIDIMDRGYNLKNKQCMGKYDNVNCFCAEIDEILGYEDLEFVNLKNHTGVVDEEEFLLISKARLLLDWYKRNQYCGFCGSKMYKKDDYFERSMICENCHGATWPRTSPAIIVAITKGDQILLGNNNTFPAGFYSVLAGFVEYGETFEQCVKREVFEEVGLEVDNIKYFGSKPWPFPNSMMIAYTAEYKSGDIKVDGEELVDASWFDIDSLPDTVLNKNSIAYDLIEDFRKKNRK